MASALRRACARVYYSLIFTLFLFPSQTIYCAQEYAVWTSGIQSTRRIALFRFFEDIIRCHSDIHRLYFTLHLLKSLRLLRLLRFQSIISLNGVALQPEAYWPLTFFWGFDIGITIFWFWHQSYIPFPIQHLLNFFPLPQGQGSFLPGLCSILLWTLFTFRRIRSSFINFINSGNVS